MAEVVTWGIVQHVKAALARITVANGYLTDIGLGEIVDDRARLKLGDSPVLLIVCGDVEPNGDGQGRAVMSSSMDLSIECAVPFVVDNAERVAHHARVQRDRFGVFGRRGDDFGFHATGSDTMTRGTMASTVIGSGSSEMMWPWPLFSPHSADTGTSA